MDVLLSTVLGYGPAGTDRQVQINNNGAFGTYTGFTITAGGVLNLPGGFVSPDGFGNGNSFSRPYTPVGPTPVMGWEIGTVYTANQGLGRAVFVGRDFSLGDESEAFLETQTDNVTAARIGIRAGVTAAPIAYVQDALGEHRILHSGNVRSRIGQDFDLWPPCGAGGVGLYFDQSITGHTGATFVPAADFASLSPIVLSRTTRIDRIGVTVTTAAANTVRFAIYESDAFGMAGTRIYQSPSAVSINTVNYVFDTVDIVLEGGRRYWLGVHFSATGGFLIGIPITSAPTFGVVNVTTTTMATRLGRTISFASGWPADWSFSSDISGATPPSIRLRTAAL